MRPGGRYTKVGDYSQGLNSSPAPQNFQQLFIDVQLRLQRKEEEIRCLKQQQVLSGNTSSFVMPGVAPVLAQPRVENR